MNVHKTLAFIKHRMPVNLTCLRYVSVVLSALTLSCLASQSASFAEEIGQCDWTVSIQTREMTDYIPNPKSTLKPVVKAAISYRQSGTQLPEADTRYENLWYGKGKAIGCQRLHHFDVAKGDGVAIQVKHGGTIPTASECTAAADTIIRLLVDSYLNGNPLKAVLVPSYSFTQISAELQHRNFLPQAASMESPVFSFLSIHLRSESSGQSQTLYYSPQQL